MRLAFVRRQLTPILWLDLAAAVSAAALLVVHALQRYGGYTPCELCLKEREVFWIALGVALVGRVLTPRAHVVGRIACVALGIAFLVGTALGTYHAGVEWRWWPGPTSCTANLGLGGLRGVDLVAAIRRPVHVVACDQAALRIAGVSLAGWNAALCLALAIVSLGAPLATLREPRRTER